MSIIPKKKTNKITPHFKAWIVGILDELLSVDTL